MDRIVFYNGEDIVVSYKVYQFNKYLKAHNNILDERALNFLANYNFESVIKSDMTINEKLWRKVYDKETSVQCDFGIKQVKILSEFEICDKVNNFEFCKSLKVV